MTLEDLVPPLELCKKIPEGMFKNTVLVWWGACVYPRIKPGGGMHMDEIWHKRDAVPAPTLQEILAALPPYGKNEKILACCVPDWADFDARVFGEHWRVGYTGDCSINDTTPATAALKLWLKLKGVAE